MGRRLAPDALLAVAREEERRGRRGKLTIFFGAAPGVGKTYAMLEAARLEREAGRNVVVGIVETHGRYDTGALLLGLELLPRKTVMHRGIKLDELDLDAVLARRPGLVLVDELAHSNAAGLRHAKRWQDVEELLDAGIDVSTTLNVQHLESLNDVVAQVTHVVVNETVPDAIFENAADVRIIDLPIDVLLERLSDGKVYASDQASLATAGFFREGNLFALRELALRQTAQRVDAQMLRYRKEHGIARTWAVGERLLVCVSASPASEPLVRAARRIAAGIHAEWIAAYVETPRDLRLATRDRERIDAHLRLAQTLEAETATLSGEDGARELVQFARSRNVTRILVGKPTHARLRDRLYPSFLEQLVRLSGDIDVHVLSVEASKRGLEPKGRAKASTSLSVLSARKEPRQWTGYVAATFAILCCTLLSRTAFGTEQLADVVMVYLLGIILVSMRWGLSASLFAAVFAVLSVDFVFVPPFYSFAVTDARHIVTFAVMFVVATLISGLTKRVRQHAEAARVRELRTASLYALSRALSSAKTEAEVAIAGTKHVYDVFGARAVLMIPDADGKLHALEAKPWNFAIDHKEEGVADWVWRHGKPAGLGTQTLPAVASVFLPLTGAASRKLVLGILGVRPSKPDRLAGYDDRQHLDSLVGQMATALDRTFLAEQAHEARRQAEREQLRNSLLSSVSHDLRTPLTVITGTASTLLTTHLDPAVQRELIESVLSEAERLNRLVRNLLDMTRIEGGAVEVRKEWESLEESVGAALERVSPSMIAHDRVTTHMPQDLSLVPFDSILLQQVLVNLLENAAKYTPPGSPIEICGVRQDASIEVTVSDRGPGLREGEEEKIFAKLYRAEKGRGGGVGLGLTICRGIITAHGGSIWAKNRPGGGCEFHFTLPVHGKPPTIDVVEPERQ